MSEEGQRDLRREGTEDEVAGSSCCSSAFGLDGILRRQRRFYEKTPPWVRLCGTLCSGAPCLWLMALLGCLIVVILIGISWNHDYFRPMLFLSPVLIALSVSMSSTLSGWPGEPSTRKTFGCGLFFFLVYWTVYKAYPVQCRSAWALQMVSDTKFMDDKEELHRTVFSHIKKTLASTEPEQFKDGPLEKMIRSGEAMVQDQQAHGVEELTKVAQQPFIASSQRGLFEAADATQARAAVDAATGAATDAEADTAAGAAAGAAATASAAAAPSDGAVEEVAGDAEVPGQAAAAAVDAAAPEEAALAGAAVAAPAPTAATAAEQSAAAEKPRPSLASPPAARAEPAATTDRPTTTENLDPDEAKKVYEVLRSKWKSALSNETSGVAGGDMGALGPPGDKDMGFNVETAETEWFAPWTNGDSLENFVLRAYCDVHGSDLEPGQKLPHVYPLMKLGISPREFDWKVPCPYGSCILTEPRPVSAGKLVFLWALFVPAFVNFVHARLSCYREDHHNHWWQWFWACALPLWLVAFMESIQDMELTELIANFFSTFFINLPQNIASGNAAEEGTHIFYLFFAALLAVAYYLRERISTELGLHGLIPFLTFSGHASGQHTFQVCVWKVDSMTHSEKDEEEAEVRRASTGGWLPQVGNLFPALPAGYTQLGLGGGVSLPETISVRLCYGGQELQRTRLQRDQGSMFSQQFFLFQENFTLSLNERAGAIFSVEMNGRMATGEDFNSAVTFTANKLEKAFRRSSGSSALSQIQQMRTRGTSTDVGAERDMKTYGFYHYNGNDGGEIWLAFCDLEVDPL